MSQDQDAAPHIRIGPAGWSYPDWEGRVYPKPKPRGFDPLAYLGRYFDCVEVNSTFYHIPSPAMTRRWVERVTDNPRFLFTVKLWQGFTHEATVSAHDAMAFNQAMVPLHEAGKLGAVLLQFPYRFHHTAANLAFLQRLAAVFREYPLVLEIRHRSWDRPQVYTYLQELGVGFCNIDQPAVSSNLGLTCVATSPVGYLRLHGRNAVMWLAEEANRDTRYDYRYTEGELSGLVATIEVLARRAHDTYAITNNHGKGQAVVNALEIAAKLRHETVPVPPTLVTAYPELRRLMPTAGERDR
jgi:uncharacterized protein YecE (DUF72 family)